ncbi:FGGY-family carbohydrate kinase [Rathayibacter soli]|uniref:FGGY-family carbohydrate kinase n=1 Tax=Rathayibacter soli TaxID=3144168 RepID=UPI0027E560E5|nr:FGGY-family carbohydrate kinase [Glaciibacter superstes]
MQLTPASRAVFAVDIGTSSSKAILVRLDGTVIRSGTRQHTVKRPHPGWVEMDALVWWEEVVSLAHELCEPGGAQVIAVGVSGMGPCVLLTDEAGTPLRPAILYGVDTRATKQIAELTKRFGEHEILQRGGSVLTTQAAGAKIVWIAENEPDVYASAKRLFMPASWLGFRLTGQYVLDQHSASQCTPLYDAQALEWYRPWSDNVAPGIFLPPLKWPGEAAGILTTAAAAETGLPEGIPVITGTIDAWSEAISVGAQNPGDLMLMYGTTMFLVHTVHKPLTSPSLWGTVGALPGTRNLAGGMSTSGAITGWLRELFGSRDYPQLLRLAEESGPGARGLLMLPYFAGERTPIMDPQARGMIAGLTVSHTAGDLYRAALEATGLGIRHNIETMEAAGGQIDRIVAVGGGTQGGVWTQIVTDIIGREQVIPTQTIGASYGAAFLAAQMVADVSIEEWNPLKEVLTPRDELAEDYDELFMLYRQLYEQSKDVAHALAARERRLHRS